MTIVVTAPNGASVQFPDGTDHATINGVMTQHFGGGADAAPAPDKYQQAAIDEQAMLKAKGIDEGAGFARRLGHGATFGADSTVLAAAQTPLEMIRHGTVNPVEGYNYAKAREDQIMSDARKNTGALGTAAEVLGGAVGGSALADAGVTATRFLAPEAGILKRAAASAADGAGIGGFSGAMEGNGLQERAVNAVKGLGAGAVLGGVLPVVGAVAKGIAAPIISNFKARNNPTGFAEGQVARGVHESGVDPNELSRDVIQAGNEGQGTYTLADSMGNAGQRLLSTVARAPGEGRTAVVQAMDARQGDQGRRLAGALREGFEAPQTAEQTRAAMSDQANREASFNYAPVKAETQPIDVSNPVAIANRAISPAADRLASAPSYEAVPPTIPTDPVARARALLNPEPPTYRQVPGAEPTDLAARAGIEKQESALRDPIGSALKEARSYLAAPTLTSSNVSQAFRAKTNIDQMIKGATEKGQGALVAELMPIQRSLDEALANTSSNYAGARDAYRIAQQRLEALDLGRTLGAKPVRSEDAIRQFEALPDPEAQQAFRVGYADPQIAQVQSGAFGTNKGRPFTSDATRDEFSAFAAPGKGDMLQRQIGRENTMFETRQTALGGSKTVDNLNDHEAMGVDPHLVSVVGHVLAGNVPGAVKTMLHSGYNALTGNTPAVRAEVAKILLQRAPQINPQALEMMVSQTVARIQKMQTIARGLSGAGVAGSSAAAAEGLSQSRR